MNHNTKANLALKEIDEPMDINPTLTEEQRDKLRNIEWAQLNISNCNLYITNCESTIEHNQQMRKHYLQVRKSMQNLLDQYIDNYERSLKPN